MPVLRRQSRASGLTITHRDPDRMIVNVEAPVVTIQTALNVEISTYQVSGTTFFSNGRNPSLPAALSGIVHSVLGLKASEVATPAGRAMRPQVDISGCFAP
jgi:hypothetical protein